MGTMTEMQARIEQLRAKPADRITEQDARKIIDSYRTRTGLIKMPDNVFDGWLNAKGRELLDKLNADGLSASPAQTNEE